MLGQQGANQRRLACAARAPEQGMVGRHAIDELARVAGQLIALQVDTDQVRQTHIEADLERQQKTTAAIALPAGGQACAPVDRGARCRQQRLQACKHGIGTLQKGV
ncbi:hypothetical protein D3C76_1369950 [compost metagenome]